MSHALRAQLALIDTALMYLPPAMRSTEARALMLAIALQESRFTHRRQVRGPARGYWQFELGGVAGVLNHTATRPHALAALKALNYGDGNLQPQRVYELIEHNDLLAAIFARLNLWWAAPPLPRAGEHQRSWEYYLNCWRPGKPHPRTWNDFYDQSWALLSN